MTSVPKMLGTWVGTTDSLVVGNPPHHAIGTDSTAARRSRVELTFHIEKQEGRHFWGEVESSRDRMPLIGLCESDGQSVIAVSAEGYFHGRLLDADTIDSTYARSGPVMVVSAFILKRR